MLVDWILDWIGEQGGDWEGNWGGNWSAESWISRETRILGIGDIVRGEKVGRRGSWEGQVTGVGTLGGDLGSVGQSEGFKLGIFGNLI